MDSFGYSEIGRDRQAMQNKILHWEIVGGQNLDFETRIIPDNLLGVHDISNQYRYRDITLPNIISKVSR